MQCDTKTPQPADTKVAMKLNQHVSNCNHRGSYFLQSCVSLNPGLSQGPCPAFESLHLDFGLVHFSPCSNSLLSLLCPTPFECVTQCYVSISVPLVFLSLCL